MRVVEQQYDVVVCGGGLAGFAAAIAAARHGAKTALVQDRPVLGGNSSSEVRVTVHGAAAVHAYARETGVVSEALIQERAINHAEIEENGWTNSVWDLTLYDMAVRTENLTLHVNTAVEGVEVADGRISTVVARVANAETLLRLTAGFVIDCTGDGIVGDLAGVTSFTGIEAFSEYEEPSAPDVASDATMGSSLHFKAVDTGHPTTFVAPEWAARYDDPAFFQEGGRKVRTVASGYWFIEIGPPWDTIHENEDIRHELTRQVLGIWDFLKNRDPYWSKQASNLALDWVGQVPGKRESRRLLGDAFVTEHDLRANRVFDDEVAFGGWYVDLHTPGGLYAGVAEPVSSNVVAEAGETAVQRPSAKEMGKYVGPYGIPLRAMVSKEIENLLFAGRNISSTHAALGSLRVMGTVATMGQAVGTHAALLIARGVARAADLSGIREVQQTLLRDGCFLPNVRNADPADLALRAEVSASSTQPVTGIGPDDADNLAGLGQWWQGSHPVYPADGSLIHTLAQWIAVGAGDRLGTISLLLQNAGDRTQEIDVALHRVDGIWDYRVEAGSPLRTGMLEVAPGEAVWVDWTVDVEPEELGEGYVRVQLSAAPDVDWKISPAVLPGQVAGYEVMPGRLRRFGGGSTLAFRVSPPLSPYQASQITSGVARPSGATNVWRSDPAEPLPQWVELAWPEPVEIAQVQVTFAGHLLREYHGEPPFFRDAQTAKRYVIQVERDGEWEDVAAAEDNYTNRVVHDFAATTTRRLRLLIRETNGDQSASVYEIRAYASPVCVAPAYQ